MMNLLRAEHVKPSNKPGLRLVRPARWRPSFGSGRRGKLVCRETRPAENVREKSSQFGILGDGVGEILHFCRSSARHTVRPAGRFPLVGLGRGRTRNAHMEKTRCSATS